MVMEITLATTGIVAGVLLLIRWFTFSDKRECNDAFFGRGEVTNDEGDDTYYD